MRTAYMCALREQVFQCPVPYNCNATTPEGQILLPLLKHTYPPPYNSVIKLNILGWEKVKANV